MPSGHFQSAKDRPEDDSRNDRQRSDEGADPSSWQTEKTMAFENNNLLPELLNFVSNKYTTSCEHCVVSASSGVEGSLCYSSAVFKVLSEARI